MKYILAVFLFLILPLSAIAQQPPITNTVQYQFQLYDYKGVSALSTTPTFPKIDNIFINKAGSTALTMISMINDNGLISKTFLILLLGLLLTWTFNVVGGNSAGEAGVKIQKDYRELRNNNPFKSNEEK